MFKTNDAYMGWLVDREAVFTHCPKPPHQKHLMDWLLFGWDAFLSYEVCVFSWVYWRWMVADSWKHVGARLGVQTEIILLS